ncbi:MAG: hypothetical protein SGILL_001657 [Bacillariaceae sp.]
MMLLEAGKRAKKMAGGKRRKALAAARRKASCTFTEAETRLKRLLGDDFDVLVETEDLAVISKPSGVPCFHRKTTTAGKIKKKTKKGKGTKRSASHLIELPDISLEDALLSCNVLLSTLNPEALGLVHRLDRGSSGCLVLAKNDETHARLVSEFFLRRTSKTYLTILCNTPKSNLEDEGVIEALVHGRPAKSKYRVLERFPSSQASLVEFDIFTGRKHQIRVHASSEEGLASPVLNDEIYGDENERNKSRKGDPTNRFFLHASKLSIPSFDIDVEAPIPSWWHETISMLKK